MRLAFTVNVPEKEESLKIFKKKVKYLAELGYQGIELAVRNPKEIEVKKIKKIINAFNLSVPTISTGEAYLKEGISLFHPSRELEKKAIERIKNQIKLASDFEACVTIGLIRGQLSKPFWSESKSRFAFNLCQCADFAKKYNLALLLEPLNRYENNFINTLEEAKEFISSLKIDNLFILADIYHMNIEERSIIESIEKHKKLISHIHIADNNRLAPGEGHIDFPRIIYLLDYIKYKNFLTAEILLKPNFKKAAELTINYFRKYNLDRFLK